MVVVQKDPEHGVREEPVGLRLRSLSLLLCSPYSLACGSRDSGPIYYHKWPASVEASPLRPYSALRRSPREHALGPTLRHGDRVLEMGREGAVLVEMLQPSSATNTSWPRCSPSARWRTPSPPPVAVRDRARRSWGSGVLVHRPPHAVPDERAHDVEAGRLDDLLHREDDVAEPSPRAALARCPPRARPRDLDQTALGLDRPKHRGCGVGDVAVEGHADVEAEQVALSRRVPVRDAVHDDVVGRRADGAGKPG